MRVVVAEDFEVLAEAIGTGLRREGMAVDVVLDGNAALEHLAVTRYDVLVLPAASTVRDRVDGLGLGADDYLPKQFDFAELTARVRALGRRTAAPLPPVLGWGDVTLDPSRRVAFRAGRRLDLSPKEFALLECLLAAGDRVVSAEELLDRVWDEAADPFTTVVKTT